MDTSKKDDKQNFKIGLYVTITSAIVLLLFYLFWDSNERTGLSCLGVKSQINDLIETAKEFKSNGFIVEEKNILLKKLDHQLKENKKLDCGFSEKSIRAYFNF